MVPAQYSKERLWRNTEVAKLKTGQTLELAPEAGTLGYEWDEDVDNGFRPAGEFELSSTTDSGLQKFTDYGSTLNTNATGTHHLTLYRAKSGSLVFGAGTVQWSWGLDSEAAWEGPDQYEGEVDPNMEQFTVNLLAEMGAQPGSLIAGLVAGSASPDLTPPVSTITSPKASESIQDGTNVTIAGSATDGGGGVVAGVEVSTDNGETWHPATLTTPDEATVKWTYTWNANHAPSTTIKSRAVDDSANLETPAAGVHVLVSCPCSLWGGATPPKLPTRATPESVELGVQFTSESAGTVTGIRFYKSATNTGTHVGSLWTFKGELLAQAPRLRTNRRPAGSRSTFSKPVQIKAATTYVAGYFAPSGHYAATNNYFYTPPAAGGPILNSPPLHALTANGEPVGGVYSSENGLYTYSEKHCIPDRAATKEATTGWT